MASVERDVLPTDIVPSNYNLYLNNLQFGGDWSYHGRIKITTDVKQATDKVVLNAKELKIDRAIVYDSDHKANVLAVSKEVSYDEQKQQATIALSQILRPGHATIEISFVGCMNNSMAGFYRAKYKPTGETAPDLYREGEYAYMFSTQFEACDARRAFPCFDEPNLKCSFEFSIDIPEHLTALSNMPEKNLGLGHFNGMKTVTFEKAPVMSTYLLAWAVGDFEYVEDFTKRKYNGKNLPVRVYTTRGLKEQGRFALEHAHKTIDLFSDVFGIEYPLPKSDLLAVHEFAMGAMENWGLVTYRTTAVLFDEGKTDERYKERVAYVVAHELAHQWFGNLVTMDWWNELWLNEGFATWVGWYAVDQLHPDWQVWSKFVVRRMSRGMLRTWTDTECRLKAIKQRYNSTRCDPLTPLRYL